MTADRLIFMAPVRLFEIDLSQFSGAQTASVF
jgi:hypothetical protein